MKPSEAKKIKLHRTFSKKSKPYRKNHKNLNLTCEFYVTHLRGGGRVQVRTRKIAAHTTPQTRIIRDHHYHRYYDRISTISHTKQGAVSLDD